MQNCCPFLHGNTMNRNVPHSYHAKPMTRQLHHAKLIFHRTERMSHFIIDTSEIRLALLAFE